MGTKFKGKILIKAAELNLDLTLLGGQSFRWKKVQQASKSEFEWRGVAYDAFWILTQSTDAVTYTVHPVSSASKSHNATFFNKLLQRYFRIDFDLSRHVETWKAAHEHFKQISSNMKSVRVLDQEPLENILSFICSQNNHIKRISTMIEWLCSKYGTEIGTFNGHKEYTFPSLDAFVDQQNELESNMRIAKFGYRAKFIAQSIATIVETGGKEWFLKLRNLPYSEARLELVTLPGIGFKVADCICLMSLNKLESVPIDTHIYKIAQTAYVPHLAKIKSVTPKIYNEISDHFRSVYGSYAGWAQAILFCSGLQQFQTNTKINDNSSHPVAKKKRK